MKTIRGSFIGLVVGLLAVAAFVASAGASAGKTSYPPCTKQALSAALKRSSSTANAKFQGSFACAGGWAYSGIIVGNKRNGFDAIAVYKAKNGAWSVVNRAKPCRTHAIPKKIYKGACTTS